MIPQLPRRNRQKKPTLDDRIHIDTKAMAISFGLPSLFLCSHYYFIKGRSSHSFRVAESSAYELVVNWSTDEADETDSNNNISIFITNSDLLIVEIKKSFS
jgi:hypothetical protein